MTLLMIEGFDLHSNRQVGGLDAGGDQDMSQYWWGSTIVVPTFVDGYLTGRAIKLNSSIPYLASRGFKYPSLTGAIRWGFFARAETGSPVLGRFVSVGNYGSDAIYVELTDAGVIRLMQATGVGLPPVALSATATISPAWAPYEFFVTSAGRVELWANGQLLLSGQGTTVPNINQQVMGTQELSAPRTLSFDHMWFTDGPRLNSEINQGVSISAAADRFEGNNGFHGTVTINGSRYVTSWDYPIISSLNTLGGVYQANVANILNFVFPVNPDTSLPWKEAELEDISSWGVCFHPFSDPTTLGKRVRLAGLCVSWLDNTNGIPIVRPFKVSGMTEFSGPWEKTNENLSYQAHLNFLPRQYEPDMDAALSLYIGNYGCILFSSPWAPGGGEVPGPTMVKVGLTFAEEYREDNRDWKSVTGSGNSFESLFESGYSVLGEGNKKFQDNFVTLNYENVPTGSCYIQGMWDYAETGETGRWSMKQIVENKGGDYKHGFRRLKIRGHGKAMQIRVTNRGDAPFVVNGWAMFITGNTSV